MTSLHIILSLCGRPIACDLRGGFRILSQLPHSIDLVGPLTDRKADPKAFDQRAVGAFWGGSTAGSFTEVWVARGGHLQVHVGCVGRLPILAASKLLALFTSHLDPIPAPQVFHVPEAQIMNPGKSRGHH